MLVALVCVTARAASANECNATEDTVVTSPLPLGCPLVIYIHPNNVPTFNTQLYAERGPAGNPMVVPLMATFTQAVKTLPVTLYHFDASDCSETTQIKPTDYRVFTFEISDAKVGDRIDVGNTGGPGRRAGGAVPRDRRSDLLLQRPGAAVSAGELRRVRCGERGLQCGRRIGMGGADRRGRAVCTRAAPELMAQRVG